MGLYGDWRDSIGDDVITMQGRSLAWIITMETSFMNSKCNLEGCQSNACNFRCSKQPQSKYRSYIWFLITETSICSLFSLSRIWGSKPSLLLTWNGNSVCCGNKIVGRQHNANILYFTANCDRRGNNRNLKRVHTGRKQNILEQVSITLDISNAGQLKRSTHWHFFLFCQEAPT